MESNREELPQGKQKKSTKTRSEPVALTVTVCDADECSIGAAPTSAAGSTTLDLTNSMYSSARSALLISLTQKMTAHFMESRHYHPDLIKGMAELLRASVLITLNLNFQTHPYSSAWRLVVPPVLPIYFYKMFNDDRRYQGWETDPTGEALATWGTIATLLIAEIILSPASWSEAALTSAILMATSIATKKTTATVYDSVKKDGVLGSMHNLYQGIKNEGGIALGSMHNLYQGIKGGIFVTVQYFNEPEEKIKSRAWISAGF